MKTLVIMYIPLNEIKKTIKKLKNLQNMSQSSLKKIQIKNYNKLTSLYNWIKFREKLFKSWKKNFKKIRYSNRQIRIFKNYRKQSPNYFLRFDNLYL